MPEAATSYDQVPYPNHSFPQTHPNHLATLGTLFGMKPAAIDQCRVLELGCARGANLLPMADGLPGTEFVGIDSSSRQLDEARQIANRLGLDNVELREADIREFDPGLGEFDYILCHGVYSWVPADVQAKILEVCRQHLTSQGIAFVSYNTYPGWHMRGAIRDMMCYHAKKFADAARHVPQARALLDFLADSVPQDGNAYGTMLKSELDLLRKQEDAYLFHDHLEEHNQPLYFHEFARRARDAGLQYLGEAEIATMWGGSFADSVQKTLVNVATDPIEMEQYMDFLRNRMFRQTLLCHEGLTIDRHLTPACLNGMYLSAQIAAGSEGPELTTTEAQVFQAPNSTTITVSEPIVKAALTVLGQAWPAAVRFEELIKQSRKLLADDSRAASPLGPNLIRCFVQGIVRLQVRPNGAVNTVSDRPATTRIARDQAETGAAPNCAHQRISINVVDRLVLKWLDGETDHERLAARLLEAMQDGSIVVREDEQPIDDDEKVQRIATAAVEESLSRLCKLSFLNG